MERIAVEDVPTGEHQSAIEARDLASALDTEHVAINGYRVPPGGGFPSGLHAHADQEEVFLVQRGTATFETLANGEVAVTAGEAIRFAPGEFQTEYNGGEERLVALALGAPRDSRDVRLPLPCPDCGHEPLRLDADSGVTFGCPDCGATHVPAPCSECGGEDLSVRLGADGEPIVVCGDCDATYAEPPLAD